jgi:hypothetical protein
LVEFPLQAGSETLCYVRCVGRIGIDKRLKDRPVVNDTVL